MERYLKVKVYNQLLKWKTHPNHSTSEVSGAHQVGKKNIGKLENKNITCIIELGIV